MEIAAAITAMSATIKLAKTLKDLDHDLDKAELKGQMAELYNSLADVKMGLTDASLELKEKDNKIRELEEHLQFKAELIDVEGFKYDEKDGSPSGFPYCPRCEVEGGKLHRLTRSIKKTLSKCPNCDKIFSAEPNGVVNREEPVIPIRTSKH